MKNIAKRAIIYISFVLILTILNVGVSIITTSKQAEAAGDEYVCEHQELFENLNR